MLKPYSNALTLDLATIALSNPEFGDNNLYLAGNQNFCSTKALNSDLKTNFLLQQLNPVSERATNSKTFNLDNKSQTTAIIINEKSIYNFQNSAINQLNNNNKQTQDNPLLQKKSPSLRDQKRLHLKLKKSGISQPENALFEKENSLGENISKIKNLKELAKDVPDMNVLPICSIDEISSNILSENNTELKTRQSKSVDKISVLNIKINSELEVSELKLVDLSKRIDACLLTSKKLLNANKKGIVDKISSYPLHNDKTTNIKELDADNEIKYYSPVKTSEDKIDFQVNPMLAKFVQEKKELEDKIDHILLKCQKYEPTTPFSKKFEFETTSQANSPITFTSNGYESNHFLSSKKKNISEINIQSQIVVNSFPEDSNQIDIKPLQDIKDLNFNIFDKIEEKISEIST